MTLQESKGKFFTEVEETPEMNEHTSEPTGKGPQVYGDPRRINLLAEIVEFRDKARANEISKEGLIELATRDVEELFREVRGLYGKSSLIEELLSVSNNKSWELFQYYSRNGKTLDNFKSIFAAEKNGILYRPWFLRTEGAWELLVLYITLFEALEAINKEHSKMYQELPLYAEGPFGFIANELKKDFSKFIEKGNLGYEYPEADDGQFEVKNVPRLKVTGER